MGRIKTIARRSFLIGSAAILGGVAFGAYMVKRDPQNPLTADAAEGDAVFNPWVKINADGITLVTPHTDLGQGARAMQAMLIAEELDVDMDQVSTTAGQPAAAYYNTALAAEAVPFRSNDDSFGAEAMRTTMGAVMKLLGAQVTGGSTSVPDSFDKLRQAGAVARETLKLAAAKETGLTVEELSTAAGAVVLPDGTRLAYTELAAQAAQVEPVENVTLRDPSEWRIIGKPVQRLDIAAKSTGTQTYGIDLQFDGMVHASVRMNPRKGALMADFDASAAEGMRGVSKIIPLPYGVAVIADNTWRAFRALEEIEIEWEAAPYPAEQDEHWAEVEASFVEDRLDKEWRNDGDVEKALKSGNIVEAEYRAPYVAHQPLEPLNAVVTVHEDRAEIWAAHQVPRYVLERAAAKLGLEVEQITLHNQYAGGSFGHRLEFDNIDVAVDIAAEMRGIPVKLTYRREEDFVQDYARQIGMARGRGAHADGKVTALDLDIATVSAARSQSKRLGVALPGPDTQIAAGAWNMRYAVPNLRVRAYAVPELAPTSSWRSVGASTAGFFAESFVDEVIHAAGADQMEERLRLVNDPDARAVLEAVAEMSNWGETLGPKQGRGVALVTSFGVPTAEVVEVTDTEDGIRIDRVWVAAEVGRVVDPVTFENVVMGGVIWGLGHAINSEITYSDGMAEQDNFHVAEGMRMHQCPIIKVRGLENNPAVRGIGEPPVPPAAAALANAIFAATGTRLREMPFYNTVDFV
ncbi:xanthine dehydrogenase family protein molybdopterin-binding subunit [Sulfitobacter donghicola]|uniref:Isoquinoline 1-oxidoreductase subunit beta n=1 Tax=Sulfitobacter donghicola DSW-25 = KCTC 12864 = JCM 14565 TaxID=1300350 RepID=A0A073IWT8_9RHOB|nr:molybdopterin cofactor-binding domain-containing protein [Sulfitobacter donghicola]KEJ89852.1 isoquinoline 1-oxidoreductase subunit beta [Sulfitobacter donghicola DSW-25 = KCTC 12864 = JCM 14565]KIN67027.1 Twin-arginine translocation pathway signal protein [Sulfitobacter donghicola DSW-25 = KCTC 12864 = JCM 14565]